MTRLCACVVMVFVMVGQVYAGTCLSQSSTPTFSAGQAVPKVCDLHGAQKVLLVDANGVVAALRGDSALLAKQIQQEREHLAALRMEYAALTAEIERMTAFLMGALAGGEQ